MPKKDEAQGDGAEATAAKQGSADAQVSQEPGVGRGPGEEGAAGDQSDAPSDQGPPPGAPVPGTALGGAKLASDEEAESGPHADEIAKEGASETDPTLSAGDPTQRAGAGMGALGAGQGGGDAAPHSAEAQAAGPDLTRKPLNPRAAAAERRRQLQLQTMPEENVAPKSREEAIEEVKRREEASRQGVFAMPAPLNEPLDTVHLTPPSEGGPPPAPGASPEEAEQRPRDGEFGGNAASGGGQRGTPRALVSMRSGLHPTGLDDVLGRLFGGGGLNGDRIQEALRRLIGQQFNARLARVNAEQLARTWTKQIDTLIDVQVAGTTHQQRVDLAETLAANAGAALARLADLLKNYPGYQAEVERIKDELEAQGERPNASHGELVAARLARQRAQEAIRQALADVGAAIAGRLDFLDDDPNT